MSDQVRHPDHYTAGSIETIDYIRDMLGMRLFSAYCLGNVIKYVSRHDKKGDPVTDLKKAQVYLEWAIEAVSEAEKLEELDREIQFLLESTTDIEYMRESFRKAAEALRTRGAKEV